MLEGLRIWGSGGPWFRARAAARMTCVPCARGMQHAAQVDTS